VVPERRQLCRRVDRIAHVPHLLLLIRPRC